MEFFRWLLGALQETLDYVSSFTTYLLGEETHPGAEESGRTRELEHCSSRHDSEVETAHSGDVSPQGYLDDFERPLTTEVTPFSQEIRVASEAVVIGTQATDAILEPSKLACKCEGQEVAGQKLSESPQFLTHAPKPRPTAPVIGNDWQRNLEGLALTQGLHQWEPEGTTLMEAIQQDGLEEVGLDTESSQHRELDRPLAGENRQGEQNGAGGTDGAQQRELEGTVWNEEIEQRTPDWALSLMEQPSELKGAAWTGETERWRLKELAKVAESQHLEEEEEEAAAEAEWDQQGETNRVEANEEIQQEVLEGAKTEGDLEGVLDEVERSHQWEPGKTVMAFKEQGWDPKWVAEEGNSHQSGLEGAKDIEDHQDGEVEGPLRNEAQAEDKRQGEQMEGVWEGTSERLVEEEDLGEEVLENTETGGEQPWEPEWTERSPQEEPTGSRASLDTCLYAGEKIIGEKSRDEFEEEQVVEVVLLEEAETSGHQPWEPDGTERSLYKEPMGNQASLDANVFDEEQVVREPEKMVEEVASAVREEAETGGHQPWKPEGSVHEGPKGSHASLNMCLFGEEQTVVDPEELREELEEQEEVGAVVVLEEAETGGHQPWEPERAGRSLQQECTESRASFDACPFGEEQIGREPEKLIEELEEVVEEGEAGGGQPWEQEGAERSQQQETMGSRAPLDTCLFGEEQIEGKPEELIEDLEEVVEAGMLEEAETGGGQPQEPEGTEMSLQQEPTGSRVSLDVCPFAGPSAFPDEVLSLDTSAQKERVMLRRKSSIRRAPSLKKPRLPVETQLPVANITEDVPSQPQAPRHPNLRHSGFGPMHPNMMAELQMRLRRPQ